MELTLAAVTSLTRAWHCKMAAHLALTQSLISTNCLC